MKYDGTIDIATGHSAEAKIWKNKKWQWSEVVQRLAKSTETQETYKEYLTASKADQSRIKDVGGYVGGYLRAGRRNHDTVVHRQLVTLDIDFAHSSFWDDFTMMFDNAAILHSTHKHHESNPRYRLVFPLSRDCSPDEYVAVSRKIAGSLGIDLFDNTTFEVNRLMFWPSNPIDVEYYFKFQDGPFMDPDEVLKSYADWTDSSLWPISGDHINRVKDFTSKQEDPENKKGIVGAFCRTYDIPGAIRDFLGDCYISSDVEDRYTYLKGSTSMGLIVYENKFAFSHHGTDPCSGKLCNSFDLVRIHKFGNDDGKKSFDSMRDFAMKDDKVRGLIASENLTQSKYDFSEELETEDDGEWMKELELDARGKYYSHAPNINLILSSDPRLKGMFRQNEFDNKRYIYGNLPWRRTTPPELMRNVDYSGVRNYIETIYGVSSSLKIEDSLSLEFEKHSFHPIREYISGLKWDGVQRVDPLFDDYLGSGNTIYHIEASRKMLVGAVARVFHPGVKFDLVVTLVGPEGTGKSTFVNKLGREWFSDTFMTVTGKDALEQIQGFWIIEIAELAGMRKAEAESIKHFITKQEDSFRPAYARVSETFKRQCIFVGTTNNPDFLRDPTGNRRFIPIDVRKAHQKKSIFVDLVPSEVDQIWAEAYQMFRGGEKLYMSKAAEAIAKQEQAEHSEHDGRSGMILEYLDKLIPEDWDSMDLLDRRIFYEDPLSKNSTVKRQYVCVAEIWCECLGRDKKDMDRYKTREINDIMKSLKDWDLVQSTKNFSIYGKQKYYARKENRI